MATSVLSRKKGVIVGDDVLKVHLSVAAKTRNILLRFESKRADRVMR